MNIPSNHEISYRSSVSIREKLAAYVLTIEDEGGSRRTHSTEELLRVGINATFIKGINKDHGDIDLGYSSFKNLLLHKRSLTRGEISVSLGHRKALQELVSNKNEMALILEDDFKILDDNKFITAIEDAIANPETWDILKFFDFSPKKTIHTIKIGNTQLAAYKYPASGAVAYLVNYKTAKRILERKRVYRAIDEDFSHPWEFNGYVWSVQPNLVDEVSNQLGGSTLEIDRVAQKKKKVIARSIWGNFLQLVKLLKSKKHNRTQYESSTKASA